MAFSYSESQLDKDLNILADNQLINETLKNNIKSLLGPLSSGGTYKRTSPRRFYTNSDDEDEDDDEDDEDEVKQLISTVAGETVKQMIVMQQNAPESVQNIPQQVQIRTQMVADNTVDLFRVLQHDPAAVQLLIRTLLVPSMTHRQGMELIEQKVTLEAAVNEQQHAHRQQREEAQVRRSLALHDLNFENLIIVLTLMLFGAVAYYTYYNTRSDNRDNMLLGLVHSLTTMLENFEGWCDDWTASADLSDAKMDWADAIQY
jgi:hypothetical protein